MLASSYDKSRALIILMEQIVPISNLQTTVSTKVKLASNKLASINTIALRLSQELRKSNPKHKQH